MKPIDYRTCMERARAAIPRSAVAAAAVAVMLLVLLGLYVGYLRISALVVTAGMLFVAHLPGMISAFRARRSRLRRERLERHLCSECGYNLRGGGGEQCPECGTPIGRVRWL